MSNTETQQELEITINVERKVTWSRQETITVKGTRDECLAEAERIEELDAEEQLRLVNRKGVSFDNFLYNENHWEYDEEEFIEESCYYDESTLEEEDIND